MPLKLFAEYFHPFMLNYMLNLPLISPSSLLILLFGNTYQLHFPEGEYLYCCSSCCYFEQYTSHASVVPVTCLFIPSSICCPYCCITTRNVTTTISTACTSVLPVLFLLPTDTPCNIRIVANARVYIACAALLFILLLELAVYCTYRCTACSVACASSILNALLCCQQYIALAVILMYCSQCCQFQQCTAHTAVLSTLCSK